MREEFQHQAQDASTFQNNELKKMQEDLAKAKKEVQVLRKQRDAKLAVHERQARVFFIVVLLDAGDKTVNELAPGTCGL